MTPLIQGLMVSLFPLWRLLLLVPLLAATLVLLDQFVELLLVLLHRQLYVVAQRRHHVLLGHACVQNEGQKVARMRFCNFPRF